VLAAFAVLWVGARTPFARGLIEDRIVAATGLPATVGRLRLGFFPSPAIEIRDLSITQPQGFGAEPFLQVGRVEVSLPWRILFGTSRVNAVGVSDATARLVVRADGISNWSALFPPAPPPAEAAPRPPTPAPTVRAAPARWSLGALDFEGGAIEFRDDATNSRWQLTAIGVRARDVAPAAEFPLELSLAGVFGASTMHYAAKGTAQVDPDAGNYEASAIEFRGWVGGEPLPLAGAELTGALGHARYATGDGVAMLESGSFDLAGIPGRFDGRVDLDEPALVAALRVATQPFAPRAPAIVFGRPLPATADPAVFESLQVAFDARLQDDELALDPLSGRLDDTNFEGRVVPGRTLLRARLDRIDLDRYLPPEAESSREQKASLEALVAVLSTLDLDAEIRVGEAHFAGAKMRGAVFRVEPDEAPAP
jgi:AsmA protein